MILLLAVIYIAFISLGLPDSLFGVSWPIMHVDFDLPQSFASVVTVIVSLGTVCTSIFAGKLIRRFGTGIVTSVSVALTAVGLFGISLSPNVWLVCFFAIVLGTGAGAVDAGLNDYVAKYFKPQHMNWLHAFWGVGVTIGPIVMANFLQQNSDWRGGYATVAVVQAVIAAIMFLSLPLWRKNEKLHPQIEIVVEESGEKIKPIKIKGVVWAVFALSFYCGMEYIMGIWGSSYLIATQSLSADKAALWISLYYGGIMCGRFISGFLAMKLSDRKLITLGSAVAVVGILLLCFNLGKYFTFAGLLLTGIGFGPIFPCSIHATARRFGATYSADIVGYQMAGSYLGTIVYQTVTGFVASNTTFLVVPFAMLGFAVLLLVFECIIEKKTAKV